MSDTVRGVAGDGDLPRRNADSRGRRLRTWLAGGTATLALIKAGPAAAENAARSAAEAAAPLGGPVSAALAALSHPDAFGLAFMLGVTGFGVVSAVGYVRTRARLYAERAAARREVAALTEAAERARGLLLTEPQVIIAWGGAGPAARDDAPDIIGDSTRFVGTAVPHATPAALLAFGTWLRAEDAQALERAVTVLRERGEAFRLAFTTLAGKAVEAAGSAIAGRAVLRLVEVEGARRSVAEKGREIDRLAGEVDTLRLLLDAVATPVWLRDTTGRLTYANAAYARAVESGRAEDAVTRGLELLDRPQRLEAEKARSAGRPWRARVPVIVAGERRHFDIVDVPTRAGSAGIGFDVTEVEGLRADLVRVLESHRRTLDQLTTGVAIFDGTAKLVFHNAAYRTLWGLDQAFLDQSPTDALVLDRLRAGRKLPEERDFRQWRNTLHEAYRALEAREHWWHLPDGRTVRVVADPNPNGGVTYLYDDVTERLDVERRYDALIRVQGETLENLAEAVAVFGSDGRLRLVNSSFTRMWKLSPALVAERPHVETVIALCRALHAGDEPWAQLRASVTGLEGREPFSGRMERADRSVVDVATVPLPDGGTLVTFRDVTDSVNVERALVERAEALQEADELKNQFVQHVSYELRSPLTTIIGFSQLMADKAIGPLNDKQREYLGHIEASSASLLQIIDAILDLSTIDAGGLELQLGCVDIRAVMEEAAVGVKARVDEHGIRLALRAAADIGHVVADERRLMQILYNLLSNAVAYSPEGGLVALSAEKKAGRVVFRVVDHGPGIPADRLDKVFERFETDSRGSRHRGVGLGLSLVRSFAELHGGSVAIDSTPGRGTTVRVELPLDAGQQRDAAE